MKTIKYILPLIAVLLFACDSEDDGNYNDVSIEATNLVSIETQPSYNTNDFLYVNATIPNIIAEAGQANPLNIMETTGNARQFFFTYVLEKQVDGAWELVDAAPGFQLVRGDVGIGFILEALPQYDDVADAYLFRGGIKLAQAGSYRLSFGYKNDAIGKVELISDSADKEITVRIASTTSNVDTEGYYHFTVN